MFFLLMLHLKIIQYSQVENVLLPTYKINLTDTETFIISDMFDNDDDQDFAEDDEEILKPAQYEKGFQDKLNNKYYRIHRIARRKNQEYENKHFNNLLEKEHIKYPEEMHYMDEAIPIEAGFSSDSNKNFSKYKRNATERNSQVNQINNKQNMELKDENYDQLKDEYEKQLEESKKSNETLKYVTVKPENTFKEKIKKMLDLKTSRNCTKEEENGYGLVAMKCFVSELKRPKQDSRIFYKHLAKMILIWTIIYAIIAIAFWVQKGWCCCCFWCGICRPRNSIDEAKKYLADNQLGVLQMADGTKINFPPSHYEMYTYKALKQEMMNL